MRKVHYAWRLLLLFAVIICSILFSACAFTDRHVNLAPPQMIPQITSAVPSSQSGKTVSVARPQ